MFPVNPGVVDDLRRVLFLFLRLILLLIRYVRMGLVVLDVANELCTALVTACVRAPVLSVQTMEALAMVSQEPMIRTKRFSAVIRLVASARARVTASGRPSGTVTTNVRGLIKMLVNTMPFSLAVLQSEG